MTLTKILLINDGSSTAVNLTDCIILERDKAGIMTIQYDKRIWMNVDSRHREKYVYVGRVRAERKYK